MPQVKNAKMIVLQSFSTRKKWSSAENFFNSLHCAEWSKIEVNVSRETEMNDLIHLNIYQPFPSIEGEVLDSKVENVIRHLERKYKECDTVNGQKVLDEIMQKVRKHKEKKESLEDISTPSEKNPRGYGRNTNGKWNFYNVDYITLYIIIYAL